jgi:hypothetical protein
MPTPCVGSRRAIDEQRGAWSSSYRADETRQRRNGIHTGVYEHI